MTYRIMKAWANIEISPRDPEIIQINTLENKLGELPESIYRIRELITRFEVCHFKYRQHLRKIRSSIADLSPAVDPAKIGTRHLQTGKAGLNRETISKNLTGHEYSLAIKSWLDGRQANEIHTFHDNATVKKIHTWLGHRDPEKIRLSRLLLSRLTWDWDSYEKLQHGGKFSEIESQASRVDICHYAFPKNLDVLLQGIGKMQAVNEKDFEGCGSFNKSVRTYLEKEFLALREEYKSLTKDLPVKDNAIKAWLIACLAKTIKENIKIPLPVSDPEN